MRDHERRHVLEVRSLTISSSTVVAMIGSRPVVGSSKSRRPGFAAMARAIATRRRWPPDNVDGIRSMQSPSPMNASTSSMRALHRPRAACGLFVEPVADVLGDRQRIEQRVLLKQHADVGSDLQQIALPHVVDALAVDEDPARNRAAATRG